MSRIHHHRLELFGEGTWWEQHWRGMPEFVQRDKHPVHSLQVDFTSSADVERFGTLVGQSINVEHEGRYRLSMWYPERVNGTRLDKRYICDPNMLPRYPVYIISKGRWESRKTARALEAMQVPYRIVVEPQEFDRYAEVIDREKILQLPFSNLGLGSIPARNWCWEHALASGAARHWILDDNIADFYRLNHNMKLRTVGGNMFRAAEDFVDRYENVGMAGFQYWMFTPMRAAHPPFALNTRIYSCILIDNAITHRWRGRYNEDTDLSLRVLKDGLCTVLFYAFVADKTTTMSMKGGNTDELYKEDGRLLMAESLREQHPDVTTVTRKYGRWQHHVNYEPFKKNALKLRDDVEVPHGVNNYGMTLEFDPNPANERIARAIGAHYPHGASTEKGAEA